MKQLVIKLSPEATEKYLSIVSKYTEICAQTDEIPGVVLNFEICVNPGICFGDLKVNDQPIAELQDYTAVDVALEDFEE